MSTKAEVLADPNSCLNRAADDEPIFVLRAKDPHFEGVVRSWAFAARASGRHEPEKIERALAEAREAGTWRERNFPTPQKETSDATDKG